MKEDPILQTKEAFNTFFKKELYGKYRNKDNVILSRGGWNDTSIRFPKLFKFCLSYTLQKRWVGYSHSLGHRNTIEALERLVNFQDPKPAYTNDNIALTIGNSFTIGIIFKQLKEQFPKAAVATLLPYYPPIIKSVRSYFKDIRFIPSLEEEAVVLNAIRTTCDGHTTTILLLSNQIGVEGRIFSQTFWEEVLRITKETNSILVIDEGLPYRSLPYPPHINQEHVIRVVSLSKKYGIPGMKLGFLLGGKKFIEHFYDSASTNYGGPLSVFFLLSEFLYRFEYVLHLPTHLTQTLTLLSKRYAIPRSILRRLYNDFASISQKNKEKLAENQKILAAWLTHNRLYIKKAYQFGGINIIVQPQISGTCHEFFLKALKRERVSVMPSVCLGDRNDTMFRITILESTHQMKEGLRRLGRALRYFGTPIKGVLLDLDGTLINTHVKSESDPLQLLQSLSKKNIAASFATGRGLYYLKHILKDNKTLLNRFFILYDGALVINPQTGERLLSKPLNPHLVDVLEKKLTKITQHVYFNKIDGVYSAQETLPQSSSLAPFWKPKDTFEGVFQIYIRDLTREQYAGVRSILMGTTLSFYSFDNKSGTVGVMVHSEKSDKRKAAEVLFKHWGVVDREVVVVGDGVNDMPLFSMGARSVAVSGALPEIRSKADIVLGDNETIGGLLKTI